MKPEVNEQSFSCSAEAGVFLVETADMMAKFVNERRKYKIGYPHYYPDTWMAEMGAKVIEEAVNMLSREDLLGLIPELTIIHAYLGRLICACEASEEGFLVQNLRWMREVPEGTLNQPIGRIEMYAAIEDTRFVVGNVLRALLPCQ